MGTGELVIEAESNGFWPREHKICDQHLGDAEVLTALRANLTEESCDFCARTGTAGEPIAAQIEAIMPTLMVGVRALYEPASKSGIDYMEIELTTKYTGYDVIYDVVDADDQVLNAVARSLTCDDWVQTNWQRALPDQEMFFGWEAFKDMIKHSLRFLFAGNPVNVDDQPSGARFLHDLVEMIGEIDGLIVPCPTTLYRGRMFRTEPDIAKEGTAQGLGSPPHNRAAANRMSPAGISMFYGATDLDTAIAEIGAHSSYIHAVVGEFTPVRELRLLNLSNLDTLSKPSRFDKSRHKAYFATKFLRAFVEDLTMPIELDGREHIDYVPTQVFTEYLKIAHPGRLDGLMFPSAQTDSGSNVVIFSGPMQCVNKGSEEQYSMLSLDPATVATYRVTTVIRRSR